jgi:hypothetical protein
MRLLENFTQLNYSAIVKIAKKYRKNARQPLDVATLLADKQFVSISRLEQLIDRVTLTVAAECYNGDYKAANALLMEKQVL